MQVKRKEQRNYLARTSLNQLQSAGSVERGARRVLHCARFFYLDSSNGAACANRALMECLARCGFAVQALRGAAVDAGFGNDPADLLTGRGLGYEASGGDDRLTVGASGVRAAAPRRFRAKTLQRGPPGPMMAGSNGSLGMIAR